MPDIQMTSSQQQQSSDSMQDNNGDDNKAHLAIDVTPSQQQHSADSTQNNNGNNRSLGLTGAEAREKFVQITVLLEMGARMLGVVACVWVVLVLLPGAMVFTVETKDRAFITVLFFLVCFRSWRYYCPPQATGSLTEAAQSWSVDYSSNIQQLALPIRFISRLFYCYKLVSAMASVVLSVMRLASEDFGKTEVPKKGLRDFVLIVFYGLALAEALMLLFAFMFSFPIMANSVGLGGGSRPGGAPGGAPGGGHGDGSESGHGDGLANQSNDCNSVEPANYSEGPADSLPNLRQRRKIASEKSVESVHAIQRTHPACPGKELCQLRKCIHYSPNTSEVLGSSVEEGREVEE